MGMIAAATWEVLECPIRTRCPTRQQSLDAVPPLLGARWLMTEFYRPRGGTDLHPRAPRPFFPTCMNTRRCINDGELIVGEKGPAPRRRAHIPELCCHSLADLDMPGQPQKIPFKVSAATRQMFAEQIIPFWQGKSMRSCLFQEMTDEWKRRTRQGFHPSSWSSVLPGHTAWTTRSTQGCSISSRHRRSLVKLDTLRRPGGLRQARE